MYTKLLSLSLALAILLTGCSDNDLANPNPTGQTPGTTPGENNVGTSTADAVTRAFPKSVSVFGVPIRGTANTPSEKMLHAAQILAEYLDNNDDGVPDYQALVDQLVSKGATLVMARDEADLNDTGLSGGERYQDLLANETYPNGAAQSQFDASLEEVLHLITHLGYASLNPSVFGEQSGSVIADAMDTARGGHFDTVPDRYPDSAWYTYDDRTCDYSCQITEYTYWALTSILEGQSFPGRGEEIEDEWKLNTRALVQDRDNAVYTLLTDPQYQFPTVLPDGKYSSQTFSVTSDNDSTIPPEPVTDLIVVGAPDEQTCRNAAKNDAKACFIIKNSDAQMYGVIGDDIVATVTQLATDHPSTKQITLMDVPGSENDEENLKASRIIFSSAYQTRLLSSSEIASGGVDFFLAGVDRKIQDGAFIGVHSWAGSGSDGRQLEGASLPRDHPEHKLYIDFYIEINHPEPEGFYFYTLNAAPSTSIHRMSQEEIQQWGMATTN